MIVLIIIKLKIITTKICNRFNNKMVKINRIYKTYNVKIMYKNNNKFKNIFKIRKNHLQITKLIIIMLNK